MVCRCGAARGLWLLVARPFFFFFVLFCFVCFFCFFFHVLSLLLRYCGSDCDILVGTEGAGGFTFHWFVTCWLVVFVCLLFLLVSLGTDHLISWGSKGVEGKIFSGLDFFSFVTQACFLFTFLQNVQ